MIFSPLEQFYMVKLLSLDSMLLDFSVSNFSLFSNFVLLFLLNLYWFINSGKYSFFRSWAFVLNTFFKMILNLILENMGKLGLKYFNIMFSIFSLIFCLNYLSLIPYSFTLTARLGTCLTLSITVWFASVILGFYLNGMNFLSMFLPLNAPALLMLPFVLMETLGFLVSPLSLGVSLVANLAAGHLLLALGSNFIYFLAANRSVYLQFLSVLPLALLMIFTYLEIAVAAIQTYVFSLLTMSYMNDSIRLR